MGTGPFRPASDDRCRSTRRSAPAAATLLAVFGALAARPRGVVLARVGDLEALGLLAAHLHLHVPLALTLPRVGLRGRDGLAGRIAGAAVHREDLAARVQAAGRLAEARRHRVDPVADELLLLLV